MCGFDAGRAAVGQKRGAVPAGDGLRPGVAACRAGVPYGWDCCQMGLSDVPSQSQRASNAQEIRTNQWARANGSDVLRG